MTFIQPTSWAEALAARAEHPAAVVVAGGTDVMVECNFGRLHPDAFLDLSRVEELRAFGRENGQVRVGSGVTYQTIITDLAGDLPGLATAARTVGSPPIRNRGTIGGNLGSASPAGDCHPPLLACLRRGRARLAAASRTVPVADYFTGPKRSVLASGRTDRRRVGPAASGPQTFSKVGSRNAMVIAICSFALALHPEIGGVGTGIGSAGPVPLRAPLAEEFLEGHLGEIDAWEARPALSDTVIEHFARLVAEAARPIDDVRGSAAYRRHALGVLARRALSWCWEEYRGNAA